MDYFLKVFSRGRCAGYLPRVQGLNLRSYCQGKPYQARLSQADTPSFSISKFCSRPSPSNPEARSQPLPWTKIPVFSLLHQTLGTVVLGPAWLCSPAPDSTQPRDDSCLWCPLQWL